MFLFTDGEDLKGIQRAQDIKYMKVLRYSLRVITAWPEKEIEGTESKYQIYKKIYTFFIEAMCLMPQILYIKHNFNELTFFELGHTYIIILMNACATSRLVLIFLKKYSDTVAYFVKVIHLLNYEAKTEYAKQTHLLVHKMSHFFTLYLNIVMVIAVCMFNGMPLYNNVMSGAFSSNSENYTLEQSVFYALPFDYQHNLNGYLVVFSFNWYYSYICTTCFLIIDLLLSLMVFHLWGHVRILIYNLEHFPRPKLEMGANKCYAMYSNTETETIHQLLRESLQYYCLINDSVSKVSDTFGLTLFIYIVFQQACGCLLLLECSQLDTDALVRYGPMTVVFFQQVIQVSIVFELLGSVILKTSCSYFIMLKTFADLE